MACARPAADRSGHRGRVDRSACSCLILLGGERYVSRRICARFGILCGPRGPWATRKKKERNSP